MGYSELEPEKIEIDGTTAWKLTWRKGRKVKIATFRSRREALRFRDDLSDLDGKDPRLVPAGRWVSDEKWTFAASVSGLISGPGRTALTAEDVERLRALGPRMRFEDTSLVRLVVFTITAGVETITLDDAAARIAKGDHLMLITPLDDIPGNFIHEWAKSQPPAKQMAGYGGSDAPPAVKLHRNSDPREVDPILAEMFLEEDADRVIHFADPPTLRMVGIARGTHDLRALPDIPGELSGYIEWSTVGDALFADLELEIFRPAPWSEVENRDWHWDRVIGLPLGPLCELQIYGSNLDGRWQGLSHTLQCQHRGMRRADRFSDDDQMMPLWRYLLDGSDENCSKCGGRSARMPTVEQHAYYSDAEALADALAAVSQAEHNDFRGVPYGLKAERYTEILADLDRIEQTWLTRYNAPLARSDSARLRKLITEARRRATASPAPKDEDETDATVIPLTRTNRPPE